MLIVCPTCATTYQIQPAALGTTGRSVRCAHCKNTWFASADGVVEEALAFTPAHGDSGPARPAATDEFAAGTASEFAADGVLPAENAADESQNALTVADAPPLAPHDQPEPVIEPAAHPFDPGTPEDVETIAARRARHAYAERKGQRSLVQRLFSLPMLIVTCLIILAAALQWRVAMVKHFPQTASLYAAIGLPVNLRGLIFENVRSTGEFHDGIMVLVIEGTIVNLTPRTLEVPRLRLALRNGAGHEVYAWTALPPKTQLGSGNALPFRARLASPPPDGRDVIVRFFTRRDVVAGLP